MVQTHPVQEMATPKPVQHPLYEEVLRGLERSAVGALVFRTGALQAVEKRALTITSGREVHRLVQELVRLSLFLEKSPEGRGAALTLNQSVTAIVGHLNKLARRDANETRSRAEAAAKNLERIKKASTPASTADGMGQSSARGVGLRGGRNRR